MINSPTPVFGSWAEMEDAVAEIGEENKAAAESAESAAENSARPETAARAAEFTALCSEGPTFREFDVVAAFGG